MSEPTVIPRGGGEVVGDTPDRRVEILSDGDVLHATWSRFGPRREGADLHVHRRHTDLFYVLDGELTVRLGIEDENVAVPAGTLVRVPPFVVHGFRNGSDAHVRYLNFHAPGQGFADFMRGVRDGRSVPFDQEDPPAEGVRPATEAVIGGGALVVDRPGLRVSLLADVEAIGIAEVTCEPGAAAAPPHLHREHAESIYVLEGALSLTAGGRELRAQAGAWVRVPPGVAHAVAPAGAEPVRVLEVHTPSRGFGAFLSALGETGDEALAVARAGFDRQPAP